jgi:hypothetical protein
MIDIVYALGTGSTWDNNELRYSLRSIEKHLKNYNRVFIIGECPGWIQNVIHIPHSDGDGHERNIMNKIKRACQIEDISDFFMFLNDDHFFLQDMNAMSYPYFYNTSLVNKIAARRDDYYRKVLYYTWCAFRDETSYNFDIHCPILYNKHKFPEVMNYYDWDKYEFVIKSLYCNHLGIEGVQMEDCKIGGRMASWQLEKKIKDRHIFSIGDKCLQPYPGEQESSVKTLLRELFPNKSKYES